ncbi:MAG: phosphoribosylformylglycinamidine synthase subunit PurL [Oligoflexia bacterium]|nr:phosphoribosylformylglycinamidine synthase subunit PurL [Oligoflexia bacterium]
MTLDQKLKHYRLSQSEYEKMKLALGHEPSQIEWALFSALWSEHCSYKSSKVHLRGLFTKHPRVVQGPGENAGVIDLGQGERVAFKMESHNHPSFIEPTQGAATGVGGILRDVFTMGARPIASMDYLCFGDPKDSETPRLLAGVVKGVGGYGNCVGVPTVNGQTTFHKTYNKNNLVNAFSLGLFRPGEEVFYGRASGVGNLIVYAGARTGRDGVHGAAMASESFGSNLEAKKPNVQIGDPFYEKLLIEACLEVMNENLIVGIQDMGAAGLTSSTFEMAARAGTGLRMDLSKVPLREPDISPEEILLSESQERMVMIVEPKNLNRVVDVFKRWDLDCAVIGEITSGDHVELVWKNQVIARVSHKPLVNQAPVYERPFDLPSQPKKTEITTPESNELGSVLLKVLKSPEMRSREWIFKQYDQRVGAKTMSACESDVALLRLPDSGRVLGMNTGCRVSVMQWHPYLGGADAVIFPVIQQATRGVKALALTDCLNFGNPEKPQVMGEFVSALKGLNEAATQLEVPIISGNVSLYNETQGKSIVGTPATGIVGLREPLLGPSHEFTESALEIFILKTKPEMYLMGEFNRIVHDREPQGDFTEIHFESVKSIQKFCLENFQHFECAKAIGRGGLAVTLARMCLSVGAEIVSLDGPRNPQVSLFAERFYSVVLGVKKAKAERLKQAIEKERHLELVPIGKTQEALELKILNLIKVNLNDVKTAYSENLGGLVENLA